MRKIDEIVVHCTATSPSWMEDKPAADVLQEIRRWHMEDRGWSDVGYHAIIHRNGEVAFGRPVERSGAHVRGRNKTTIGISLVGGRGGVSNDKFEDHFTEKQDQALRNLIKAYTNRFPSIRKVSGHNEYANKACPCFNVMSFMKRK